MKKARTKKTKEQRRLEGNARCRAWRKRNPEKVQWYGKKWQKENPERAHFLARRWEKNNPEKVKSMNLKKKYGISIEDFFALQKIQNNRCRICHKKFDKTPSVDHHHKTGAVRGLLCGPCNTGLGMFKDSLRNLKFAMEYLKCSIKNGTKKCVS